ncbi:MAG: type II secretion system protein [Candidatus Omnitrophica bacterium]|nr:type II secretion system protein [Candidatus Omnitrophota bacterium]
MKKEIYFWMNIANKAGENRIGFTLIELIMVILLIGILAALAVPKYFDLQSESKIAAENSVVAAIKTGIANYYVNGCVTSTGAYPATLDNAVNGNCTAGNPCFDIILSQGGMTSDWSKRGSTYIGPNRGIYVYNNISGSFSKRELSVVPVGDDLIELK